MRFATGILVSKSYCANRTSSREKIKEIQQAALELTGASWGVRICRAEDGPSQVSGGEEKTVREVPDLPKNAEQDAEEESEVSKTLEIFNGRKVN